MAEKPTRRRKSAAAEPEAQEVEQAPAAVDTPPPAPAAPTAPAPAVPLPPTTFVLPENLLSLHALQAMPPEALGREADRLGVASRGLDKQALVKAVLDAEAKRNNLMWVEGVVELHQPDLVGFLRSQATSYIATPDDIFIGPSVVRRLGLRHGQTVQGYARPPRENERYFTLAKADAIMGLPPEQAAKLRSFEDLVPHHPESRLIMETTPDELDTRIVDLVTPVGRGQRALIVAPPRTGKTVLLQKIAKAIFTNHADVEVIVLLIDERPEEVTDFRANVPKRVEVVASTFDERPDRHMQVCEMVMEKARRLVEVGRHVVIIMDSLTRMARAYNTGAAGSGKILSGGLDATAMQKPKKFFGSARAIEKGGSLTIIATALIETNSRGDEVIFEEFKGTGNAELHLSRALAEKRVYPAIDIAKSGTRREELLMDKLELQLIHRLRRVLSDMNPVDAMELLKNRVGKCKTNAEFLITMTAERD